MTRGEALEWAFLTAAVCLIAPTLGRHIDTNPLAYVGLIFLLLAAALTMLRVRADDRRERRTK